MSKPDGQLGQSSMELLDMIKDRLQKEFTRQDNRAERRFQRGVTSAAADGWCNGLEFALNTIEKVRQEIQPCEFIPDVYVMSELFREAYTLLSGGKKIKVDKRYCYNSIPTIRITGDKGTDMFELDCIGNNTFESYMTERPVGEPEEISVVGYSDGNSSKIVYIKANPQMNVLTAHLEDGNDVGYNLSILDMHSFKGEYEDWE